MKKIVIIDGQGGKIGSQLISCLRDAKLEAEIVAVGTNSIATQNMLRSSPDAAATGENSVVVACRDADFIIGPVGIVIADALLGEVTPRMATAVGQSRAKRVLIPVNKCETVTVGVGGATVAELIAEAAALVAREI